MIRNLIALRLLGIALRSWSWNRK